MSKQPKKLIRGVGAQLAAEAAVTLPMLRVELLENRQAIVEGCRGVLEYSDCCIRLSANRLILRFCGSGLLLKSYSRSSAIVEGNIEKVELM